MKLMREQEDCLVKSSNWNLDVMVIDCAHDYLIIVAHATPISYMGGNR